MKRVMMIVWLCNSTFACVFALAALCVPVLGLAAPTDESGLDVVKIPLDHVWAIDMPGTIDIAKVVPDSHKFAAEQIQRSLSPAHPSRPNIGPAFAVKGIGLAALDRAKEVLVDGQRPNTSYRTEDEISVVFFSRWFAHYVHLDAIEKSGNAIRITYRFVSHEESNVTQHFALIPVGKLSAGKYELQIVQAPLDAESLKKCCKAPANDVVKSVVCQSSQFEVSD